MKNKTFIGLIFCIALITVGCSKDSPQSSDLSQSKQESDLSSLKKATQGATQLSGVSYFDATGECDDAVSEEPAYALLMTGDLVGCWYTFIDEFECSPSGTYREIGREYFVGTYNGMPGTFWTEYKFEAKYEGCDPNGSYLGAEIKGRCQHPVVEGSGTGVFEGVTGRIDMKDDIEAGNYPYRGHLKGLNL